MEPIRPALLTTEFWAAVVPAIMGILTMSGAIVPDKASELTKQILVIVGALLTIATSTGYVKARSELKQMVVDAHVRLSTAGGASILSAPTSFGV